MKTPRECFDTLVSERIVRLFNYLALTSISALVLEELNEPSPEPITERLKTMPKGITGMYELILRRLGSKGGEWEHTMRRKLLLWVTLANRPIKVSEMQYACVTIEGRKTFDPNVVVVEGVVGACKGFLLG
jgi:hypothetical protein